MGETCNCADQELAAAMYTWVLIKSNFTEMFHSNLPLSSHPNHNMLIMQESYSIVWTTCGNWETDSGHRTIRRCWSPYHKSMHSGTLRRAGKVFTRPFKGRPEASVQLWISDQREAYFIFREQEFVSINLNLMFWDESTNFFQSCVGDENENFFLSMSSFETRTRIKIKTILARFF